MKEIVIKIIDAFAVFVAFFSGTYILFYLFLAVMSYYAIKKYINGKYFIHSTILNKAKYAKGISVIAPAFNEGATIVENVKSLLSISYPKYEIVIVNDGSHDDTLEKLIREFDLVKVDFYYIEQIKTMPVRGHYKSKNPVYSKLLVVDKENGKSKADATNAGINSAQYPLFVCTDVDCILKSDTLTKLVKPFLEHEKRVIATGAAIRISNSCEVRDGFLIKVHFPSGWLPRFQELEYIRSFLFGRMAWSQLNGLLLVSGGLGMFDKEIAIAAGGYWHKSLGEDMELITRMRKYMHDTKQDFLIKYIPESLCWTEVPATKKVYIRQRTRWARGLAQTLQLHSKMFFNPRYGITGLLILPYFFAFEFLVPLLEMLGLISLITGIILKDINYEFLLWGTLAIYLFYINLTIISILLDELLYRSYAGLKEILILVGMAIIEPIVYHPLSVYASLKGYWHFFLRKEQKWGNMQRQGFNIEKK